MKNHGPFANPEDGSEISHQGERYVPLVYAYNAAMHLGHMASYKLALRYAYEQKVLDLGCGTGYGAHFLASFGAREVVAADLDEAAVTYARKTYPHSRIHHLRLDGDFPLPFADRSFDFVFCSQVIEHIGEPVNLLKEIRRILKTGGFCLITAPNKDLFSPDPNKNPNEYHVNEMNLAQYAQLGRQVFPHIKLAGIPQNCLKLNPDKTVSVKLNEEIVLEDYRMRFDNLEVCENLLLFGHSQKNGRFEETLADEYLAVSTALAPCFWDAAVKQWVTMGIYPKTKVSPGHISRPAAVVKTGVFSPANGLYRIDIVLVHGGHYIIDVTLRKDSSKGPIIFHTLTDVMDRKLRLVFPPLNDSANRTFHLELRVRCRIWDRLWLLRRKSLRLPRFVYIDGHLPVWTFHRFGD